MLQLSTRIADHQRHARECAERAAEQEDKGEVPNAAAPATASEAAIQRPLWPAAVMLLALTVAWGIFLTLAAVWILGIL